MVISPVSVAIALAMLERGASGAAQTQLRAALRIDNEADYHAAMTALRRSLESAEPPKNRGDDDFGDLEIAIANAAYLQRGYPVKPSYVEALEQYFGPMLKLIDFAQDQRAAVDDINGFIEDATRGHIAKVLEDVDPATVFALVNALYLKASWLDTFEKNDTVEKDFTRLDGTKVTAPLMHGRSGSSKRGDGWVAARKFYVGRLAAEFVLPDVGRFDDVAARLAEVFREFERGATDGTTLVVPRFTTRVHTELRKAFATLGIVSPYERGNLLGIADDEDLVLDQALHATFLAMDEDGTEAAAATVLTGVAVSAPAESPVAVVLDRPFFFRIVDTETRATLFIGQVLDPTAG